MRLVLWKSCILGLGVALGAFSSPPAAAAPAAEDFFARCQSGVHPVMPPRVLMRARGIDIDRACPVQSSIDQRKECQDAATVMKETYEIMKEVRKDTCAKAGLAAAEANKNCKGQSSCLEAQKKANAAYGKAIGHELDILKSYREVLDAMAEFAVKELAVGGTRVLGWVKDDMNRADDDGRRYYGPRGLGGAAKWLKFSTNRGAYEGFFRNEDKAAADAVVERFKNKQGSESDISGLKSDYIREPLQIAQVTRDWDREVASYERRLRESSIALNLHRKALGEVAQRMGTSEKKKVDASVPNNERKPSSISEAKELSPGSGPAPERAGDSGMNVNAGIGALTSLAKLATAAGPLMQGLKPDGSSTAESSAYPVQAPAQLGEADRAATALAKSELAGDAAVPGKSAEQTVTSEGKAGFGHTESGLTQSQRSANSGPSFARKLLAASSPKGSRAARASVRGSSGDVSEEEPSSPEKGKQQGVAGREGKEETAEDSGTEEYFADGGAAPGEFAAGAEAGSNEMAVSGIVAEWSKSLGEDRGLEEIASAANEEVLGGESASLFSRVHYAHERAMKRGIVLRGTPTRL